MPMVLGALTQAQMNYLAEVMRGAELDLTRFDWSTEEQDGPRSSRGFTRGTQRTIYSHLTLRGTSYLFTFGFGESTLDYRVAFAPAKSGPFKHGYPGTFQECINYFIEWVAALKEELKAPDLWEAANAARELFAPVSDAPTGDQRLSKAEVRSLRDALDGLRTETREKFKVTGEQLSRLETACDAIVESAGRVTRKDLKLILAAQLLQWVLSIAMTTEEARSWLAMANASVAHFFRHLLT